MLRADDQIKILLHRYLPCQWGRGSKVSLSQHQLGLCSCCTNHTCWTIFFIFFNNSKNKTCVSITFIMIKKNY